MLREILRANRPARQDRFAWLKESASQMNVFITFLVGGGIVLSGVAWLVDRVASTTAAPSASSAWPGAWTRSATRPAACSSTTSRSWRRTCPGPTTRRSASCCAGPRPVRIRPGHVALGVVGLAVGVLGVLRAARGHAVDAPAGSRRLRGHPRGAGRRPTAANPARRWPRWSRRRCSSAGSRSPPTWSGRSTTSVTVGSGPCWPRRWTRPTAASSAGASRTGRLDHLQLDVLELDAVDADD